MFRHANYQFAQLFISCVRRIAQFVNFDLGLVPRPRSLAAVTQLGWKLHYSPATVIQPPLSLRRSRSWILQRLTALINYARELSTVAGLSLSSLYSGFLALTLGCPLPRIFAPALSSPFPALAYVASSRA